jgi:hypothetical protein
MTTKLPAMNPLQPAIDEMLASMRVGRDALRTAGSVQSAEASPLPQQVGHGADDDGALARAQAQALRRADDIDAR